MFPVNDAVVIADNVRMSELPQQVHFLHQQLLLFLAHTAITHLLPHIHLNVCIFQARLQRQSTGVANLPISFSGNLSAGPEGSSSNGFQDLIFVQLRRVSRHRARLGECGRLSELRQCINRRVQSSLRRIIAHARAYHHGEMNGPTIIRSYCISYVKHSRTGT